MASLGRLLVIAIGLLTCATLAFAAVVARAPSRDESNGYRVRAGKAGPILDFTRAQFNFSGARAPPAEGWRWGDVPSFKLLPEARRLHLDPPRVWVRFRFDRAVLGDRAIAIHGEMFRDDYTLYVNGAELHRTRADEGGPPGWNSPLFATVPATMLRQGANDILFRIETSDLPMLGIGAVHVGADSDIRASYNINFFFANIAPQIVSGYLLILTIGAISFWAKRPGDRVFGWFIAVGLVWLFRNLHYFVQQPPFAPPLFWSLTTDSLFVLLSMVFAFATSYFALPRSRGLQVLLAACCVFEIGLRNALVAFGHSELPSFLLTIPLALFMLALLFRACRRRPVVQNWLMLAAISAGVLFSYHDMLLSFDVVRGAGFYLQPYGGLLIFAAFDATLTLRLQSAMVEVEDVNLKLEAKVVETIGSLTESEAARAQLHVALAVDGERQRIMREIHDGIGSSLLTALINAKGRGDSPEMVTVLTRALTDLRIGIDSLEPIQGDVVALLANLRHRMERELKGAGLAFNWKVELSPILPWLDPIGALHILRILQEAIGNAMAHSEAREIEVRCGPGDHEATPGILIQIVDRGIGFDGAALSRGKGIGNMTARAEALNGRFSLGTAPGRGTVVSIWLPLGR